MTDHLATGMKRMIRTVARSASLSDRLGEQSRLLRLTGNRSTLDFRPAEHGASSWDLEMSITPTEPKPYGNAETREPVIRLRPTGTPSAGRAMSVPNGQNPPHTWFDVPKNSSIVGIRAA